ncbi:hypothetical protein F383_20109 [Gossypium arboreum]|uniref:Uncharacterized protein n=1 Tax=Gossypium arboreum TaxID=29729 RepID=A0A0B0NIV8_GOSAR|nr:hypothetical protein F383_20109 [Gossypium arboreum]
MSVDFHLHN